MSERRDELRSTIASTIGGVMCREVGAITGDLEVSTRLSGSGLEASVRYAGANEWYAVDGSPVSFGGTKSRKPEDLHELVVKRLTTPGIVSDGNEEPASLRNLRTA